MEDVEGLRSTKEIRQSLVDFREQLTQMEEMFDSGIVDLKTLCQQYALEGLLQKKLIGAVLEKGS